MPYWKHNLWVINFSVKTIYNSLAYSPEADHTCVYLEVV